MCARTTPTPPVEDAVGAGTMPRQPDHQWPVMAVVGWPPVLRGCHHLFEIGLHSTEIEAVELVGVGRILHPWDRQEASSCSMASDSTVRATTAGWRTNPSQRVQDATPGTQWPPTLLVQHRGWCLRDLCLQWSLSPPWLFSLSAVQSIDSINRHRTKPWGHKRLVKITSTASIIATLIITASIKHS